MARTIRKAARATIAAPSRMNIITISQSGYGCPKICVIPKLLTLSARVGANTSAPPSADSSAAATSGMAKQNAAAIRAARVKTMLKLRKVFAIFSIPVYVFIIL